MSTKISMEQFMHHVNLIVAEKTKTMLTGITMDAGHSMTRQARHRVRTLGRGKIGDTYLDQSTKVTWTCVEVEGPEIGDPVYGMWTTWEANTLDNNVPTHVDPSFDAKLREIDPTIKKRLTEKELYALIFVFMGGRWTLPRFRIDQLLGFSWKVLIPVSLVNLVVTAFVVMVVRP